MIFDCPDNYNCREIHMIFLFGANFILIGLLLVCIPDIPRDGRITGWSFFSVGLIFNIVGLAILLAPKMLAFWRSRCNSSIEVESILVLEVPVETTPVETTPLVKTSLTTPLARGQIPSSTSVSINYSDIEL